MNDIDPFQMMVKRWWTYTIPNLSPSSRTGRRLGLRRRGYMLSTCLRCSHTEQRSLTKSRVDAICTGSLAPGSR